MTLSDRLWAGIDDIYASILAHPFIAGLTDGSLEREAFRFYGGPIRQTPDAAPG